MPYKTHHIRKVYWTIGEIACELGIETSTIRFWDQGKFKKLIKTKQRDRKGIRRYSKEARDLIHQIHHLSKVRKFTLDGVLQELQSPLLGGDKGVGKRKEVVAA